MDTRSTNSQDAAKATPDQALACGEIYEAKAAEGTIYGYVCLYGNPETADLHGDYFTPNTDFGRATTSEVWYQHGLDPVIRKHKFTIGLAELKRDEYGVFTKFRINLEDPIGKRLYESTLKGEMGLSSGVPAHLVERRVDERGTKEILVWPLGADVSLTPWPADRRARASAKGLPSLDELLARKGMQEASPGATEGMCKRETGPERNNNGGIPMADMETKQEEKKSEAQGPAIHDSARVEKQLKEIYEAATKAQEEAAKAKAQGEELDKQLKELLKVAESKGLKRSEAPETNQAEIKAFQSFLRCEAGTPTKAMYAGKSVLMAGSDPGGGYTRIPEDFRAKLIEALDAMVVMRQICPNKFMLPKAESLGVPTLTNKGTDAAWTAELDIGAEDTAIEFGKRELRPHDLGKYVKVSRRLLRVSAIDIEGLVRRLLATKLQEPMENNYLNGDGFNKPLGIFVASDDGIPTSRDVAASATTAFTANDLIDLVYTLDPRYWGRARWVFHQEFIKRVRKLASTTSDEYLWPMAGTGLEKLDSPTLLGFPYSVSSFAPSTFTASKYVAVFGDFEYYWIVDGMEMEIEVLRELFAATNQVGFVCRTSSDGAPVLAEAFVRMKMKDA